MSGQTLGNHIQKGEVTSMVESKKVDILDKVIERAKEKGKTALEFANVSDQGLGKFAERISASAEDLTIVRTAVKAVCEEKSKAAAAPGPWSEEKWGKFRAAVLDKLPEEPKAGGRGPIRVTTGGLVTNLVPLGRARVMLEGDRLHEVLMSTDAARPDDKPAAQGGRKWPHAHLSKDEGGMPWEFSNAVADCIDELYKNGVPALSRDELRKKLEAEFSRRERIVNRRARRGAADSEVKEYISLIGWAIGAETVADRFVVGKGDVEAAKRLMTDDRRDYDAYLALSAATRLDFPSPDDVPAVDSDDFGDEEKEEEKEEEEEF